MILLVAMPRGKSGAPLAWPSFLLLADGGWMGQLADQHFPIQPRALARFVQQSGLRLFAGVPIFFPNSFEILSA